MTDSNLAPAAQPRAPAAAAPSAIATFSRSALARGVCAGAVVIALGGVADAQPRGAQQRSIQRVPAAPAENTVAWAADNCSYQFNGGTWRSLDTCRVMRSRTVYDTYKPSTRSWSARFDESEPGWIAALALNTPGPVYWVKFPTNGSGKVLVLVNGRWQDVAALGAAQRGAAYPQAGMRARTLRPGEIAPGVRREIPMYGPTTPEEKRWMEKTNQAATNIMIGQSQSAICEQGRAAYPVDQRGNVRDGWHGTLSGPRMNSCR